MLQNEHKYKNLDKDLIKKLCVNDIAPECSRTIIIEKINNIYLFDRIYIFTI